MYPDDPHSPLQKKLAKMTRPAALTFLQQKIIADSKAGKPAPTGSGRRGSSMLADLKAKQADTGLPRLPPRRSTGPRSSGRSGYTDEILSDGGIIKKQASEPGSRRAPCVWTPSGLPGGEPGFVSNVTFVPGARGQGVQMRDSVVATADGVGLFERTQPYSLDFWVKLRADKPYEDPTRPEGPDANVLYSSGGVNGVGYEIGLVDGVFTIRSRTRSFEQLKIALNDPLPWALCTSRDVCALHFQRHAFYIAGKRPDHHRHDTSREHAA